MSSEADNSISTTITIQETNIIRETTISAGIETTSQDNISSQNFNDVRNLTDNVTKTFPDQQPPNFIWAHVMVKYSAGKSTWLMRKLFIGDGIFFKYHLEPVENRLSLNLLVYFKLMQTVQV